MHKDMDLEGTSQPPLCAQLMVILQTMGEIVWPTIIVRMESAPGEFYLIMSLVIISLFMMMVETIKMRG